MQHLLGARRVRPSLPLGFCCGKWPCFCTQTAQNLPPLGRTSGPESAQLWLCRGIATALVYLEWHSRAQTLWNLLIGL